MLIYMRAYLTPLLVFSLFSGFTAAYAAEPLSTLVVQPHRVDIAFPAESLVEAVQQTTVAAQIAGRVLEVRADAGQRVAKGDVLVRIDGREAAETARAAEAQFANAKL
ncbi:biotin/lipoyl-binding protein, partial [Dechloromonas sp.]|uniref:biotin/lipoyl-binding protein n=1 Tax=Dechloromonas sp. TaxID=1917218 RepID=UPI00216E0F4E